jgi:hypothetical protein
MVMNRLQKGLINSRIFKAKLSKYFFSNANTTFFSNSDRDFYSENNNVYTYIPKIQKKIK